MRASNPAQLARFDADVTRHDFVAKVVQHDSLTSKFMLILADIRKLVMLVAAIRLSTIVNDCLAIQGNAELPARSSWPLSGTRQGRHSDVEREWCYKHCRDQPMTAMNGRTARGDAVGDSLEAAQRAHEEHIAALDQLRLSDRIATLGRLASSVAHELGNPLNVIELRAQLITSGAAMTLEQAQQSAAVIVEQTRRMTRIIGEVLSFARTQPARIARTDLVEIVRKALALSQHIAKKHHTNVQLELCEPAVDLDGDADKLLQIIVNLVVNGIQAMPGGGTLRVRVAEEHRAPLADPHGTPRHYVCVDVTDHGVGIPANILPQLFEPFFSTRTADGGTGLGLSVAQGIAHEHEGWIGVTSELGRGSSFKVYLPKDGLSEEANDGR